MAAEHLTAAELETSIRGVLAPRERLRMSDHLASCAECRTRAREIAGRLIRPNAQEDALTYELLADYLDDKLDPLRRREVEEQLRLSPRAAEDLANLTLFRAETNALPLSLTSKGLHSAKTIVFPSRIGRWLLPLAALFLVTVAGFWWQGRAARCTHLVNAEALARLPDDLRGAVRAAEETGRLKIPTEVKSLGRVRSPLAGAPLPRAGFRLLRPIATAIGETRPEFVWSACANASSYRVLVMATRSGEIVARGHSDGAETRWQPSSPLPAGESYQWQVEAWRGSEVLERVPRPPEPEARFAILTTQAATDFARIEQENDGSPFILAVAAARAGLLEKAEAELQIVARKTPGAKVPNEMLQQLRKVRSGGKSEVIFLPRE